MNPLFLLLVLVALLLSKFMKPRQRFLNENGELILDPTESEQHFHLRREYGRTLSDSQKVATAETFDDLAPMELDQQGKEIMAKYEAATRPESISRLKIPSGLRKAIETKDPLTIFEAVSKSRTLLKTVKNLPAYLLSTFLSKPNKTRRDVFLFFVNFMYYNLTKEAAIYISESKGYLPTYTIATMDEQFRGKVFDYLYMIKPGKVQMLMASGYGCNYTSSLFVSTKYSTKLNLDKSVAAAFKYTYAHRVLDKVMEGLAWMDFITPETIYLFDRNSYILNAVQYETKIKPKRSVSKADFLKLDAVKIMNYLKLTKIDSGTEAKLLKLIYDGHTREEIEFIRKFLMAAIKKLPSKLKIRNRRCVKKYIPKLAK